MAPTLGAVRGLRLDWRLVALVGLTTFYLLPALKTGYFAEDCYHSVRVAGRIALHRTDSLLDAITKEVKGTVELGRFFPLTPTLFITVFYLIRDVATYKAYLIAVTVLDLVVFYYLVRRISGNGRFACLAGCVTLALFQFRIFIDPLLAFFGQIQLWIACLLLSLIALDLYLEKRRWGWLAASTVIYLLCTLAYEATYALVSLHLLLIVRARREWLVRLKLALPFLGIVGACAVTTIVVRRLYPSDLYFHKMSFAPGPFFLAMLRQPTAALPLSYFLADRHHVFDKINSVGAWSRWVVEPGSIAIAAAAFGLCLACLQRRNAAERLPAGVSRLLIVFAVILIILPIPLIAMSPAHRQHFSFGVGWIVLLVECFGVGLLMATMIWQMLGIGTQSRLSYWKPVVVSSALAVLLGATYRANLEVATRFSAPPGSPHFNEFAAMNGASFHRQRLNIERALAAGLMDDVPDGSVLELAHSYLHWHDARNAEFFYAKHTGKRYRIVGAKGKPTVPAQTFRVRDASMSERAGFVVLSRAEQGNPRGDEVARLFVRGPGVNGTGEPPGFFLSKAGSPVPAQAISLIRGGHDWGLFSLRGASDRIAVETIRPIFDSGPARGRQRSTTVDLHRIGENGRLRR